MINSKDNFVKFQLTLKRSNTLELEDVQEDVSEDIDMGKNSGWVQGWQTQKSPFALPVTGKGLIPHLALTVMLMSRHMSWNYDSTLKKTGIIKP